MASPGPPAVVAASGPAPGVVSPVSTSFVDSPWLLGCVSCSPTGVVSSAPDARNDMTVLLVYNFISHLLLVPVLAMLVQ